MERKVITGVACAAPEGSDVFKGSVVDTSVKAVPPNRNDVLTVGYYRLRNSLLRVIGKVDSHAALATTLSKAEAKRERKAALRLKNARM